MPENPAFLNSGMNGAPSEARLCQRIETPSFSPESFSFNNKLKINFVL